MARSGADLSMRGAVRLEGAAARVRAGESVALAGDFNGDGRDDVIVGASRSDNNARRDSGSAFVVYGRRSGKGDRIELAALRARGMRIDGANVYDWAGESVAAAGDFNGDGRDDVIVGASGTWSVGRKWSGSAYVVYGRKSTDPANVDLAAPGARAMRIEGADSYDRAGASVAAAGDLNGDGRDDVIVGASGAWSVGRKDAGAAYVIYGQRSGDPADVDLAVLGARGMRIDGAMGDDFAGSSVAAAGDFNGDGRDDVIIGAPLATDEGDIRGTFSGSAYVVYGEQTADPADVDLAALGARGLRFEGGAANDEAGASVAAAGDINGDGRDDVIIGAPDAWSIGRKYSGAAYVVYGTQAADPADVDLAALGAQGMRIEGAMVDDSAGSSVAAAGDVNGDGRRDVIIGAPDASNNGRADSGSSYVVYGAQSTDPSDVDLAAVAGRGMRIDGAAPGDDAGASVAGGGDLNGDGRDDVIVGAPGWATRRSGAAHIVYGPHRRPR